MSWMRTSGKLVKRICLLIMEFWKGNVSYTHFKLQFHTCFIGPFPVSEHVVHDIRMKAVWAVISRYYGCTVWRAVHETCVWPCKFLTRGTVYCIVIVTSFKSKDHQSLIAMRMNVVEQAFLFKMPGFFIFYKVDETKFLTNQVKADCLRSTLI